MFFKKMLVVVMLAVVLLPVLKTHAQDGGTASEGLVTFGGHVTGSDNEFVAVGIGEDSATIYICDGQADKGTVTIAEWFSGPVVDNRIDITSEAGHRVEVSISGDAASGKFTFADGTVKEFELELLEGRSALYRSEFAFGDIRFVSGWLVLPDGSVRGATRNLVSGELTPATFINFSDDPDGEIPTEG